MLESGLCRVLGCHFVVLDSLVSSRPLHFFVTDSRGIESSVAEGGLHGPSQGGFTYSPPPCAG